MALFAPLLMSFLLIKVSGVVRLERDMADRRPAHADFMQRTSAFVPWRRRPERRA